ncbi:MAG: cytochrome c [Sphingobium sp.]
MTGLISMHGRVAAIFLIAGGIASSVDAAGPQVYSSRCSMCHQPNGAGIPGQFPRLSGRVGQIAASKDGRSYLVKVVLFGMFGPVDVDGRHISGMMPPMGSLADQDVADTLNFVVTLEKPKKAITPFTAAEVKAIRNAEKLTAAKVASLRAGLASKGTIP